MYERTRTRPRKKHGYEKKPMFVGDLTGRAFPRESGGPHKKAGRGFREKIHAACSASQVVEPEAGRVVQVQMINLVIGVVTRGLAVTDATSDRVGARGAKLLNGFDEHQWQAGLQLPFRFTPNSPAGDWSAPD